MLLAPQRRFLGELSVVILVVLVVFIAVDGLVVPRFERWLVAEQTVDLQTPSALYAKLDYLRRKDGYRAALIGDSVILGLCLREHGDSDWLRHGPTFLLEKLLERELPEQQVQIVNFGFNGALPADLAEMARLLQTVRPQLVVVDINLRSFSEDFAAPDTIHSRPWLGRIHLEEDGTCQLDPVGPGWQHRWQAHAEGWLLTNWKFYRLRELALQGICEGNPGNLLIQARQEVEARWNLRVSNTPSPEAKELAEMELLMKAQARYATVNLRADHPQRRGFEQVLNHARQGGWRTLLFYARENPAYRDALIDPSEYYRLRGELGNIIQPFLSPTVRYHAGVATVGADHYYDHVHVDAVGYQLLLEAIGPGLQELANIDRIFPESSRQRKAELQSKVRTASGTERVD